MIRLVRVLSVCSCLVLGQYGNPQTRAGQGDRTQPGLLAYPDEGCLQSGPQKPTPPDYGNRNKQISKSEAAAAQAAPAPARTGGYVNRNTPLKSEFWLAIQDGDIKKLKSLIRTDTNFNFIQLVPSDIPNETDRGTTPLLQAVSGGHLEMVEFLIQHGAAVNFHPAGSGSALHAAAWNGNAGTVRALLRHGAFVDERDEDGETPLLLAASNADDLAVIKELAAAKANLFARTNAGENAIMLAAWQHHLDTVKFLVGLGVDACAKNNDGETAIDHAQTNLNDDPGKQEIISFLREKCGS